jgi:copper transport protein
MKRIALIVLVAAATSLTLPAAAWAHAALLQTTPVASRVVNVPPNQVSLRYSEPVEPRFAIVSVTDAGGHKVTAGPPRRSPVDADTLLVPLKKLRQGWYLVYWRVISVDGHPVRGAFTFAVGPNEGPAPQFVIPSTSETAASPRLVTARWLAFLGMMAAIGLFVLRIATARPLVAKVSGTRLRSVTIAFGIASAVALIAIPV